MARKNAVVLAPAPAQELVQTSAIDHIKSELAGRGESVVEIPADEAGIEQASALSSGGPVIMPDPGVNGGYKIYDGATGVDITKKFKSGLTNKEDLPGTSEPGPVQQRTVKFTPKPQPKVPATFKKNHVGLSAGMSNLMKNEDSFEVLAANNPGAQITHTKTTGRFRLFYEHYFSEKYGIGLAVGTSIGGRSMYNIGNRTLNIEGQPKTATLYVLRRLGRHFNAYLGGGADISSFKLKDPSNLAGVPAGPGNFEGNVVAPHGEAGLVLSAGNFSLRLSIKQTLSKGSEEITRNSNGTDYRLIVRDSSTVSSKVSGQPLAQNEKYFKADLGGFASGITIGYSFSGW